MICLTCKHFATKTTPSPSFFLLYGCRKKKKSFGIRTDFYAMKMDECKDREKLHYSIAKV